MFRGAKASRVCAVNAAAWMQRRAASLQSEKPCASLADKIVRGKMKTTFYTHPSYVMSRDKMLDTIWVDIGVFHTCAYVLFPFFIIAYFFKA
ncbi:hypothetical protein ABL78_7441 [Leptomonas seymouri]|uniref:Uncharacterized protein n=1 Tax=Leptomonas seymouri TaxID=5684 RepID=A0A0N1PCA5_LEPSE|nr:hypothetical protein ABL78_7441 [Leptomonas seymouri]|eukprot:KPI83525.1 hypothetical protein ABL78_7441 [Leptomonas seymouri]